MKGFVLDENVPVRLAFRPTLPVVSSSSVPGKSADDSNLWDYARALEAMGSVAYFFHFDLIRPARPSNADLSAVHKAHQQGSNLSNVEPKRSDQTTGVLDMSRVSNIRECPIAPPPPIRPPSPPDLELYRPVPRVPKPLFATSSTHARRRLITGKISINHGNLTNMCPDRLLVTSTLWLQTSST